MPHTVTFRLSLASPAGRPSRIAMDIAGRAEDGALILCMPPDTGERYFSTPLYEEIEEVITVEEIVLMESTPAFKIGWFWGNDGAKDALRLTLSNYIQRFLASLPPLTASTHPPYWLPLLAMTTPQDSDSDLPDVRRRKCLSP